MIKYTYVSQRKSKGTIKATITNVKQLFNAACDEVGLNMTEHPRYKVNASYQCTTTMTPEKLVNLFEPTKWSVSVKLKHEETGQEIDYFDINK